MATEILRPNAAGDETNIPTTGGMGTGHWGRVSDEDDATYLANYNNIWTRDLYNLPSPSGSGVVNFVRIYIRIRSLIEAGWRKTALKIDGSVYETGELVINNENWYTTFVTWNTNPKTGAAWTFAELVGLQIGINLKAYTNPSGSVQVAEVWLHIDYTPPPPVAPTVTTQAVSDIAPVTATGNGNMTDNGGENASKRGVCWNTTGNPTVANDKSEEIGSFGVGAFTRPMTGLTPGQHYYVRAYAYNSAGYGYGGQVDNTRQD